MHVRWWRRDRLLTASYAAGVLLCVSAFTEPARRALFTGSNGFAAFLLPVIVSLALFAGWFVVMSLAVHTIGERRERGWLRAVHPLIALVALTAAAWWVPWETLYWRLHWARHGAAYERLAPQLAAGAEPLLGQVEAFPLATGSVVALPDADAALGVFGRATVQEAATDSAAVLFFTSAWSTDNWTGYIYMARANAPPAQFGGYYYVVRRIGPHWWFVAST